MAESETITGERLPNGADVIESVFVASDGIAEDGWIVVCDAGSISRNMPYVTWWVSDRDRSAVAGNYFANLDDARIDFARRAERRG